MARRARQHKGRTAKSQPGGQVRIIGGRLRGSKLTVTDADGLRPSGDRSRETLFNWLQAHVPGARCLDLFAGSGALAIEALSRGAQKTVAIERNRNVCELLRSNAARLDLSELEIHQADAISWLKQCLPETPFDLVFVDPPFDADLYSGVLDLLPPILSPNALVYVETPANVEQLVLPDGLRCLKQAKLGRVSMYLLENCHYNQPV